MDVGERFWRLVRLKRFAILNQTWQDIYRPGQPRPNDVSDSSIENLQLRTRNRYQSHHLHIGNNLEPISVCRFDIEACFTHGSICLRSLSCNATRHIGHQRKSVIGYRNVTGAFVSCHTDQALAFYGLRRDTSSLCGSNSYKCCRKHHLESRPIYKWNRLTTINVSTIYERLRAER